MTRVNQICWMCGGYRLSTLRSHIYIRGQPSKTLSHFVPLLPVNRIVNPVTESILPDSSPSLVPEGFIISDQPSGCPPGFDLINKYVVVRYDNVPFPGLVISFDEQDIQVQCMHKVGPNRFFWPSLGKKICVGIVLIRYSRLYPS